MSETALIVGVTLLAVLVGALLPVLYQLMQTLRETRRVLTVMESHTRELGPAVKAIAEVGESVRMVNQSLQTTASLASVLAPPLASLLRSLRSEDGESGGARQSKSQKRKPGAAPGSVGPTVSDGIDEEEAHHGI